MLLVTGGPKFGSTSATRWYQDHGWRVEHESFGPDGAVFGTCWPKDYDTWELGARAADLINPDRIHLVCRHPQDQIRSIIPSLATRNMWEFFNKRIGIDRKDRLFSAAKIWLVFHEQIEKWSHAIHRIEDCPYFLNSTNPRIYHEFGVPRPTWADLMAYPSLAEPMARMTRRLGYGC